MKTTKTLSLALLVSSISLSSLHAQSARNAVKIVARPLPLSTVRLTGGPLKRAQDLMLSISSNSNPIECLLTIENARGLNRKPAS